VTVGENITMEDFLDASLEEVRKTAPDTFIYAASGTRRAAALAGIATHGDEFARWSLDQLWRCVNLFFDHGVKHLCMPLIGPSQFEEETLGYSEYLWEWVRWGLAGDEAIEHYRLKGWRVRIAFHEFIPELKQAGDRVLRETPKGLHTLWCFAVPQYHLPLQWMFEAALRSQVKTVEEAVEALYGEVIPHAGIYLSTGKPLLSTLQIPPLLVRGVIQGYWSQRPGYSLDDRQLRSIFYDTAYLRKTWLKDKSGRAEEAMKYREVWERAPVLGVGMRLGAFWYPAPIEPMVESGLPADEPRP
jgi:hypothetical protein